MQKLLITILLFSAIIQSSFADTFTNKATGISFNGYATLRNKGSLSAVYKEKQNQPQYLNLSDYQVERNFLGRKNQIHVFSFRNPIELKCETEAFEKAVAVAANQGPLFIMIDIDTPGGSVALTTRICSAIETVSNCPTVAFVSGGKYGGAYSAGAIISLACNEIIMAKGTSIGAATSIVAVPGAIMSNKEAFGTTVGEKFDSAWRSYCVSVAQANKRPSAIVKAMVDKDTEVLEVDDNGKTIFIEPGDKKESQSVLAVLNKKGSILTLSADQALACGIADYQANSRQEIPAVLGLTAPRFVLDQELPKARRGYEATKKIFEPVKNNIDSLVKNLEITGKKLSSAISNYNSDVTTFNQAVANGFAVSNQNLIAEKNLVDRLTFDYNAISDDLIANCQKAISLKQSCPDLEVDIDGLKQLINSVQAGYR